MKNKYEVRGNTVAIFMNYKGSTVETVIDIDDFDLVNSHDNSWFVDGSSGEDYMYAVGHYTKNSKKHRVSMHRLIMDAPRNMFVDHINHNTLDNTRGNLRLVTPAQNQQNIKGVRKDSSSGKRNISYVKRSNKWCVYITKNKKNYSFGNYDDIQKAEEVAEIVRKYMMPFANEGELTDEQIIKLKEIINPLKPRRSNENSGIKHIHKIGSKFKVEVKREYYGVYNSIDEAKMILDLVLKGEYKHVPQKRGPKIDTLS